MDRFINVFINVVMRRLINVGINKGMNAMSRRKPNAKPPQDGGSDQSRMASDQTDRDTKRL